MKNDDSLECLIAGECLAGRVRVLNRVVTGVYEDALRPHNVRISQMSIIVAVAVMGPVLATDVCRRLHLDKSTLSRDLERILERGWVRATPTTGRSQPLEITPAGRALIQKVKPSWEAAQKRILEMIGPELAKGIFDAVDGLRAAESEGQ